MFPIIVAVAMTGACCFATQLSARTVDHSRRITQVINHFYSGGQTSKGQWMAGWVDKELWGPVRHGLDRRLSELIANDAFVRSIMPRVEIALKEVGEVAVTRLRGTAAEAMIGRDNSQGQYESVLSAAQQIAKKFHFPKQMHDKINAFVINTPNINAFAIPSHDSINFALLTGLMELLNEPGDPPDKVSNLTKSVIAHELAHHKNRHTLQRVIVLFVYNIKKRSIIPKKHRARYSRMMYDQTMQALFHIDPQDALSSQQGAMYRRLFDDTWQTIEQAIDQVELQAYEQADAYEEFEQKITELFNEDNSSTEQESELFTENEIEDAYEVLDSYGFHRHRGKATTSDDGPPISFILDLARLSRSHEITCDRFARIATSKSISQQTNARLMGGRGATPQGLLRQAEAWGESIGKNNRLIQQINNFRTHPVMLMRLFHDEIFEESTTLKYLQTPLHRGLTLYLSAVRELNRYEYAKQGSGKLPTIDVKEPHESFLNHEKLMPFQALVQSLGKVIIEAIIPAEATNETDLNIKNFSAVIEHLQEARQTKKLDKWQKKRLSIPATAGQVEGLIYTLNDRLHNLQERGEIVKKALDLLRPFLPSNVRWIRDKSSGRWVQRSGNDENERWKLEEFRKLEGNG